MDFLGRFARLSLVVVVALVLFVAFAYALASAFLVPSGGLGTPQIAAEESPPSSPAGAPLESAALTTTVGPASSAQADTSMATVSCQRPAGQPSGSEPFSLRVGRTEAGEDPIAVAVDLVGADSQRSRRTVESAVLAADGSLEIEVPESMGPEYVDCLVIAVQRGDRVVFTGN